MIFQNLKKILTTLKAKKINYFSFCIYSFIIFCFLVDNLALSDEIDDNIKKAAEMYQIAETNGIAHSICRAIEIGKILMVPLFGIMFSIIGLHFYQGNVKWSIFITFVLGIGAMNGAGTIAEFFMPGMGLQYGCKCAIERKIRDENGEIKRYATNLNYDCTPGLQDYEEEYGKN